MICVSIGTGSPAEAKKVLQNTGFIELRADLLSWQASDYADVIRLGGKLIFTCRPGEFNDEERLELFTLAAESGVSYLDVEIESGEDFIQAIRKLTDSHNCDLIVSYHNYEMTPSSESLENILNECYLAGADIAKIACRAYSGADSARLLSLYAITGRKVILGMGKAGKITRIAAPFLGSEFTFASPSAGSETAEGQFNFTELKDIIHKIQ
ncbi:MAG: type I 3-dehydroquinate dehydratase [Bacteroidales bacterium]|nr:type I 3-dehydroquinate dehydratase [Bacteroidales bacterium]